MVRRPEANVTIVPVLPLPGLRLDSQLFISIRQTHVSFPAIVRKAPPGRAIKPSLINWAATTTYVILKTLVPFPRSTCNEASYFVRCDPALRTYVERCPVMCGPLRPSAGVAWDWNWDEKDQVPSSLVCASELLSLDQITMTASGLVQNPHSTVFDPKSVLPYNTHRRLRGIENVLSSKKKTFPDQNSMKARRPCTNHPVVIWTAAQDGQTSGTYSSWIGDSSDEHTSRNRGDGVRPGPSINSEFNFDSGDQENPEEVFARCSNDGHEAPRYQRRKIGKINKNAPRGDRGGHRYQTQYSTIGRRWRETSGLWECMSQTRGKGRMKGYPEMVQKNRRDGPEDEWTTDWGKMLIESPMRTAPFPCGMATWSVRQ
ncbi:hypothetical protein BU15DRAFT_60410 [Melanogaster broomeanus]|nr:hypothetical protein BU15DRAFT_60410 [Melanogaster broomeanus]